MWAVNKMQEGYRITRKEGFGSSGCEYLKIEDGFIVYYSNKGMYLRNVGLCIEDYIAEDWVLL